MPRRRENRGWIVSVASESPLGPSHAFHISGRALSAMHLGGLLLALVGFLFVLKLGLSAREHARLLATNVALHEVLETQALELAVHRAALSGNSGEVQGLVSALGPTLRGLGEAVREVQVLAGLEPSAPTDYSFLGAAGVGGPSGAARSNLELTREVKSAVENETAELHAFVSAARTRLLEQRARAAATPQRWPVQGFVSSDFGLRRHPISGLQQHHEGLDIAATYGTAVQAPAPGKVVKAAWNPHGYGNQVVLDHGYGFKTMYAHLSDIAVSVGDTVDLGESLGRLGSTGNSTGPHLHYEVWMKGVPIDPSDYLP